jgi:hypothetical protein
VRDHRGQRRAKVVRDVGEELRLERVTRPQIRDLGDRFLEPGLEYSNPGLRRMECQRLACGVYPTHARNVPSETTSANSSSASMDSSSC